MRYRSRVPRAVETRTIFQYLNLFAHREKENIIDVLQQAQSLYADGKIQKSLKDVKKAYDLYYATKELYDENDSTRARRIGLNLKTRRQKSQNKVILHTNALDPPEHHIRPPP